MTPTKLRFNLSSGALSKAITLLSSSALLATNGYLIGRSVIDHLRDRKRERVLAELELLSQTLASLASLSKVITNVLDEDANGQ